MLTMKLNHFNSRQGLNNSLKDLLLRHLQKDLGTEHAVMLSGGSTPLPVYEALSNFPASVSKNLHIFYSDERIVPSNSKDSNYGSSKPMLDNFGIEKSKVFRIEAELGLQEAGKNYDASLKSLIDNNGRISLGLLGLGADGHTASIFNKTNAQFQSEYTLTVSNQLGFDRVSVSSKLLRKVELIVIVVCGESKKDIILKLKNDPNGLAAGLALNDHPNVELWTDISESKLYE